MSIWIDLIVGIVNPVLANTNKLIRLAALVLIICLSISGSIALLMRFLPVKSDIIIPWKSGPVIFERYASEYETEYVAVIHPQGWQDTGIQIKKNDTLRIMADGSVAIDLQGLVTSVNRRSKLESRDRKADLPERKWTPTEIQSIKPKRAWTGPNGYAKDLEDTDFPARTDNKVMRSAKYGALLLAFIPTGKTPFSDPANPAIPILVGTGGTFQAPYDSKVWFIVNDVWDKDDPLFPDKFYIDNIGDFYARISVIGKNRKWFQ